MKPPGIKMLIFRVSSIALVIGLITWGSLPTNASDSAESNSGWTKAFGGPSEDYGRSVIESSDGGYVVTGATASLSGNLDLWLIKVDRDGNKQWDKPVGGSKNDHGWSVFETLKSGV